MLPPAISTVLRALRSRQLAVSLIGFFAVYGVVGTIIPQGPPDSTPVRTWAVAYPLAESVAGPLALHTAFASPLFLAFAGLLVACTSACAIERTRRALMLARGMRELSARLDERLRDRPQVRISATAGDDPAAALEGARSGLQGLRLRLRGHERLSDGISGTWALFGSPLFHWSIVALMLVAAAGQAMRSEGSIGLPVGDRVADERANYLQVSEGPYFGERFTGVELIATDIVRHFKVGDVDYGAAPIVAAYRDGVKLAEGRLHPNSPLRAGSLLVHMADFGPAATLAVDSASGGEIARDTILLDRSPDTSSGTAPNEFSLGMGPASPAIDVRIQVIAYSDAADRSTTPAVSRAIIETATAGSGAYGPPVTLAVGESLPLSRDARLLLLGVKDWARVSVTNDWSVAPIYVLFCTATLALAVAVLVPARRASVMLVETDSGWFLHVATWHSRGDPMFRERVLRVVREAAGVREDS
jgi:hypothetical protein